MAKLVLKFEQAVLKEFSLGQAVLTIGRLPDNPVQVDNLAVSGHHAKIYWEAAQYILEDNNSLNGTFLNNRRVSRASLKDGDEVLIGKHVLCFKEEAHEDAGDKASDKIFPPVPMLDATVVLDTRQAKDFLAHQPAPAPDDAPTGGVPAFAKEHIGVLKVMDGKTDQKRYTLIGKMTVIGKSDMASIRLKGWFAPQVAAVINKRDHKYFVAASEKDIKIKINGQEVSGQHELSDGDIVEVARVKLTFGFTE